MAERKAARRIWTRDGLIELKPLWQADSLGTTREERLAAMVEQYAASLPPYLRDATKAVYERAYRRAGLMSGSPDDIDAKLPPEPAEQESPADTADGPVGGPQSTGTSETPEHA